jgi:hypothetical protein
MHHVAELIAQDLDLDVTRVFDQLLHIDSAIAESAQCFARSAVETRGKIFRTVDAPHALAAAARDSLQHDWISGRLSEGARSRAALFGSGHNRRTAVSRNAPRRGLRSHRSNRRSGWSNEDKTRVSAGLRELRILAEKTVARMDGIHTMPSRGVQNAFNIEVAFARRRRPQMRGFIGFADMKRGAVGVGINGDRADTHLAKRANNTQRDLAAIGYQNFLEHRSDCNGLAPGWRSHEPDEPFRRHLRRNQARAGHNDNSDNADSNKSNFLELTHA